jgi:hypothetical protein
MSDEQIESVLQNCTQGECYRCRFRFDADCAAEVSGLAYDYISRLKAERKDNSMFGTEEKDLPREHTA